MADTIADDFDVPWGLIFLADGDALVSERNSAKIIRVTAKGKKDDPRGGVRESSPRPASARADCSASPPLPATRTTLFVYCTTGSDNRVARVSLAGGRVGKPKAVLTDIPTSTHHHGGRLLFDADGMLLVSTGDAEQPSLAQDRESLAGKILRIRPDGRAAAGNPFDNRTWSYGHRNIEGLAFDADGRLWATEFGDKKADELNLISKGKNYGWPDVEGESANDDFVNPAVVWEPDEQLLTGRPGHHPLDRVRRQRCRVSACSRCRWTARRPASPRRIRRRPRSDPQRRRRPRRLPVGDDVEHRRSPRPG